jgi:hypothetical protein
MARDQNLDEILEKFWEQEEPITHPRPQSSSDVECERHFLSTHTLNPDGTYTVRLPFRPDHPELGKSRETAIRRFKSVESHAAGNQDGLLQIHQGLHFLGLSTANPTGRATEAIFQLLLLAASCSSEGDKLHYESSGGV